MKAAVSEEPQPALKQSCLEALSRLGGKATQEVGAESLRSTIRQLGNKIDYSVVLTLLCATGKNQAPGARKECVRLLGLMASSDCPCQQQILQASNLNRALGYIRSCGLEADKATSEACAETLTRILQAGQECSEPAWSDDGKGNPVLQLILDMLQDTAWDSQVTACLALGQAVAVTGSLAPSAWKLILRLLNSHAYKARVPLVAATASSSTDCSEVWGLASMRPESLRPFLGSLLGRQAESGLLGCISDADWVLRKAAVEGVRALAVGSGLLLDDQQAAAAAAAVSKVRHDKSKPVRSAAAETLLILSALADFREYGGGTPTAWVEQCRALAKKGWTSPTPRSPMASTSGTPTCRRQRTAFDQAVHEKFKGSAGKVDTVLVSRKSRHQGKGRCSPQEDENISSENVPANFQGAPPSTLTSTSSSPSPGSALGNVDEGMQQRGLRGSEGSTCTEVHSDSSSAQLRPPESTNPLVSPHAGAGNVEEATAGAEVLESVKLLQRAVGVPLSSEGSGSISSQDSEKGWFVEMTGDKEILRQNPAPEAVTDAENAGAPKGAASPEPQPSSERSAVGFTVLLEPAASSRRPSLSNHTTPRREGLQCPALPRAMARSAALRRQSEPGTAKAREGTVTPRAGRRVSVSGARTTARAPAPPERGSPRICRTAESNTGTQGHMLYELQLAEQMRRMQAESASLRRAVSDLTSSFNQAVASLVARVAKLEQAVGAATADGQWQAPGKEEAPSAFDGSPRGRPSLPLLEIKLPTRGSRSAREHTAVKSSSADGGDGDLELAFVEALQGAQGASASGELELLRLMQKSGVVWSRLSEATCGALLQVLIKLLHERTAVGRILPWLQDLALPGSPFKVSDAALRAMHAALQAIPPAEDKLLGGKVSQLLRTLEALPKYKLLP